MKHTEKAKRHPILKGIAVILAAILVIGCLNMGYNAYKDFTAEPKSDLKFIFVHGLSSWGSYDTINHFFPYWGLSGGSVIRYLNQEGYHSYAASVAPTGSAWDRACELYAQLAGTVVDYGKEHSERCNHARFGRDFSKEPLIEDFENSKIVLIGHSFGGATVRLFSEILVNGSAAEQAATDPDDLSGFFRPGNQDQLFAMCLLAAPSNGTTAYDMHEDSSFDEAAIEIPEEYLKSGNMVSKGTKARDDGRSKDDYAAFDMHIDNAMAMNETITTFDNVYYFAYPCSVTAPDENGQPVPNPDITEGMFMKSAILMSRYTGSTKGGVVIDESWCSNDGLVNEVSAKTPSSAPGTAFIPGQPLTSGIWYEMPTTVGDHMYFQGGMTKRVSIRPFYLDMVQMICALEEN